MNVSDLNGLDKIELTFKIAKLLKDTFEISPDTAASMASAAVNAGEKADSRPDPNVAIVRRPQDLR